MRSKCRSQTAVRPAGRDDVELLDLDAAPESIQALDSRSSELLTARFVGGLSVDEAAEALRVPAATVTRDWNRARAWRLRELRRGRSARER
jgi:DNA-directed RNA polymerase specialized sigma24 family protein